MYQSALIIIAHWAAFFTTVLQFIFRIAVGNSVVWIELCAKHTLKIVLHLAGHRKSFSSEAVSLSQVRENNQLPSQTPILQVLLRISCLPMDLNVGYLPKEIIPQKILSVIMEVPG